MFHYYGKLTTTILTLLSITQSASFSLVSPKAGTTSTSTSTSTALYSTNDRRNFITQLTTPIALTITTIPLLSNPSIANAGIDLNALKTLPVEGDVSGAAARLKQLEVEKTRPEDTIDIPFEKLASGVSYREYREGKGEATVGPGSKVAVEMTIRCKSFATANDPGGLKYFTTKEDTDFNEVAWTVGSGELLPGLEEGMMGMHKNGVRRIEVPSTMVFAARNDGQLPMPKASNKQGNRLIERLFKTEATLLFEVLVTRIK